MITAWPLPLGLRFYDDEYVQKYRNLLVARLRAGDDAAALAIIPSRLQVWKAHELYFQADQLPRQLLEANLLINEPLEAIGNRFSISSEAVDCYEKLFFNVRDRLQNSGWIANIIQGPHQHIAPNRQLTSRQQREGHVYRLFAHGGGPIILEAMMAALCPTGTAEDDARASGCDAATKQLIVKHLGLATMLFEASHEEVLNLYFSAKGKRFSANSSSTNPALNAVDKRELIQILKRVDQERAAQTA